jgi:hypothetical protein
MYYKEPDMMRYPIERSDEPMPTHEELTEARFRRFMRELSSYERKLSFDTTLNAFLDLYSSWLKTHEPDLKMRVVMLAFELNRLDPTFECTLSFAE